MQVAETKYFDSSLAATALTASTNWTGTEVDPATLNTLFVPVQGSGINNRVGRKVQVKKIKVQGQITCVKQTDQTASDEAAHIRLILYQDMQSNGTQSQGEDLMDGSSGTAAGCVNAFQSLANFGRFRVLRDYHLVVQNPNFSWDGTNLEQQGLVKPFKMSHVFRTPLTVHFNATNGGTMADIVDNQFHIIAMTYSTNLAPSILYNCRVSFVDV